MLVRKTYTWFSPLGEKNHAASDMATTITSPMMTLHLRVSVLAWLYPAIRFELDKSMGRRTRWPLFRS